MCHKWLRDDAFIAESFDVREWAMIIVRDIENDVINEGELI